MKPDIYIFEYSTKTCKRKRISYTACSYGSALKRFEKNVRYTKLFDFWKASEYPNLSSLDGKNLIGAGCQNIKVLIEF